VYPDDNLFGNCHNFALGFISDALDVVKKWATMSSKKDTLLMYDYEAVYRRHICGPVSFGFFRPLTGPPSGIIKVLNRQQPTKEGLCPFEEDVEQTLIAGKPFTNKHYRECINLGSFDYLGFTRHTLSERNVLEALQTYGTSTTSPPLFGGTTKLHKKLERTVAGFLRVEDALIFGMGWGVNYCAIPALVGQGSLIVSDALNHNSIVNGARMSGAEIKTFPHADFEALEAIIRRAIVEGQPGDQKQWRKILIIVEGVYSMEGGICDLAAIVEIKKKYKCYLYVDEAHSIGALGATGRGVCEYAGVDTKDIDILMGTFTKSFGAIGGYIAGQQSLIEPVRQIGASQMFSAGLSSPCVAQVLSALRVIDSEEGRGRIERLHKNSDFMRRELIAAGLYVLGDYGSPIIPVLTCHLRKMRLFSRLMLERGVAVVVVAFPAVPLLFSRARICVSANLSTQQIRDVVEQIKEVASICHIEYKKRILG